MKPYYQSLDYLGSHVTDGYGPSPIPSPIDVEVEHLVKQFFHLPVSERNGLQARMTSRHGFVLTAYSERMVARAVRCRDIQHVCNGLLSFGFAISLLDFREVIPLLHLLHDSSQKIGADLKSAVALLPELARQTLAVHIEDFFNRPKAEQQLAAMGYFEAQDNSGFRYARNW